MSRFDTTTETQARVLEIPLGEISDEAKAIAYRVLTQEPAQCSKWFNADAVRHYQDMVRVQLDHLKSRIETDQHSRQHIMHGPASACWLTSQILSLRDGGFHMIAVYRSLDLDHAEVDAAFQLLLGEQLTGGKIEKLTVFAGSLHSYRSPTAPAVHAAEASE